MDGMSKVIILGSSNAVPTLHAENTHMIVVGEKRVVLVDCVSNPIVRLEQAGVDFHDLTDMIITHFHPDHASGVPLLLMDMWLMGRKKPIQIYGLDHTIDRIEAMMELYNWSEWPDFFPVEFCRLPSSELTTVLDCSDFLIKSSPVHHMIPAIGLRLEFKDSNKIMAYSCDTEPCEEVVRLSEGANVLIHEATGESFGHSSARQAGEIATKAGVGRLYLIHYGTAKSSKGNLIAEAGETFDGEVKLAKDFMILDFKKRMPLSHFGRGEKSNAGNGQKWDSPSAEP
jgi:ribonuclease Z